MESARILKGSLEICATAPTDRESSLIDFIELLNGLNRSRVNICKEEGFDSHQYSFGTADRLFYMPWDEARDIEGFGEVSQAVYQMLAPALMQRPGIGPEIDGDSWNEQPGYKADFGLRIAEFAGPVYCPTYHAWHSLRTTYYRNNQQDYEWKESDNDYLPNEIISNGILAAEVERHSAIEGYSGHLDKLSGSPLHILFHEGVCRHKGPELAAYISDIGTRVCEANFYRFEEALSQEESRLSGGSRRKIFSLVNREGRRQFVSIDFAHGMLEYIDCYGTHTGEYRLTGDHNSDPDTDHGLKSNFRRICQ